MEVCDLEIMDGPRPLSAKEIPGADVGAIMAVRQRLCGNYETAVCAYGATVISTPLRALALYEPAGWSGSKRLTACLILRPCWAQSATSVRPDHGLPPVPLVVGSKRPTSRKEGSLRSPNCACSTLPVGWGLGSAVRTNGPYRTSRL